MIDLLIHYAAFARIEAQLRRHADRLRPLIVQPGGEIESAWGAPFDGPCAPHIAFGSIDAFLSPEAPHFMRTVLDAPSLDWFHSSAAGIDNPILAAVGRRARLYTSSHEQAHAIAEWALWQALDFFRGGAARREDRAQRLWKRRNSREIAGSHWLIYGFGHIGRETARRVRAMGGGVTGVRRAGGADEHADRIIAPAEVGAFLPEAEIVCLCAPHTRETEGLANAAFFAAMRDDALFMNVGRGALVVESDLLAALDRGRPAFAALDVFAAEPLPPESPFWTHPRVSMTPHNSAESDGTRRRVDALFLSNLELYLSGGQPRNVVPRQSFSSPRP
jgi:phosphoglycerate dehydrogenase-like enzyme